ncbi:type II toxin-antitoxin system VapC family toxin [Neisseria animalis]|uniref:Type II toxin-antitoxin system VapC family toxin n=1 Tax=Neisseria animalis TaxID=492 RepID=A0A5P3MRU2_NEIAN|nr:type II toxin-antitoxin system VapC family toxin [Neisseria animalis]QEY23511.1 type II toxin-antitoxin system VapC family toxin [Neisseria animalis]ROW33357.1 type II toxin-antitoxin system VapC family toxin [Neisseria animalis]VEE09110.1 PIN domain-containing protein [Neisseria animalis]
MKYLLDTHILLWAACGSQKLSGTACDIIENQDNDLLFSAASIWEIAIKSGLGRADFVVNPVLFRRALLDNGYIELPINGLHSAATANLPDLHKDPFDRILIAQSQIEGIVLLSADEKVAAYGNTVQSV